MFWRVVFQLIPHWYLFDNIYFMPFAQTTVVCILKTKLYQQVVKEPAPASGVCG